MSRLRAGKLLASGCTPGANSVTTAPCSTILAASFAFSGG